MIILIMHRLNVDIGYQTDSDENSWIRFVDNGSDPRHQSIPFNYCY